jgi:hypothetical protein
MPQRLERSSVEFYLGVAVTILTVALPMTWWLRALLLVAVAGLFGDIVFRSPYTEKWSTRIKVAATVVVMALIGAAGWKQILEDYKGTELPDISMRLVYPQYPSLVLKNISGKVAKQVRFQVTLWNLDATENPKNPLQIPTDTFDFIKPNDEGGPQNIFQRVESSLKPGAKLFGSIGINCPDCQRGRTFWVWIVWKQDGWFSEIDDLTTGGVMVPTDMEHVNLYAFAAARMAAIPEDKRKRIEKLF